MKYIGINRDAHPKDTPEGFGLGAKNGNNNKVIGAAVNEDGFAIHQASNFNKYNIVKNISGTDYILKWNGEILIRNNDFVVFSIGYRKTATSEAQTQPLFSEIGILYKTGEYKSIIRDFTFTTPNKLNFDPQYPVTGEYTVDSYGNIITASTDNKSVPLYINISKYETTPFLSGDLDLNNIAMFQKVDAINTAITVNESGGSLENGTYYIQYRYKNEDLTTATNLLTTNPIHIFNADSTTISSIEGDTVDLNTNKSIILNLTNVNTSFTEIEIVGIIKRVSGTVAKILKTVKIQGSSFSTILDGSEGIEISLQEAITPTLKFKKVYKFTQVYNRLYAAKPEYNMLRTFQQFANFIQLMWVSEIQENPINNFNAARKIQYFDSKTFLHKEVYAFYIHLELIDGTITEGFHIPNNYINGNKTTVRANSSLATAQGFTAKKFQVEDTVVNVTNVSTNRITGDFGYWENEDEFYPNTDEFNGVPYGGEDLRNQKVRHHRFPSMQYIKLNIADSTIRNEYGSYRMDRLGVFFQNLVFPVELQPLIKGYFLSYARRNYNNCTVIGRSSSLFQSKLTHTFGFTTAFNDEFSSGLNANLEKTTPTKQVRTTPLTPYFFNKQNTVYTNETVLRFYDVDLLKNQPDISPVYLWQDFLCIRDYQFLTTPILNNTDNNGRSKVDLNNILEQYSVVAPGPGTKPYTSAFVALPANVINGVNTSIRKIKKHDYIPERVNVDTINNGYSEDFLRIVLDSEVQPSDTDKRLGVRSLPFELAPMDVRAYIVPNGSSSLIMNYANGGVWNNEQHRYFTHSLMALPTNCYFDFTVQDLVSTGKYFKGFSFGQTIFGGDGYVTLQTYHTKGWGAMHKELVLVDVDLNTSVWGLSMVHGQYMTTKVNYQLLSKMDNNAAYKFYPRYTPDYIKDIGYGWAKVNTLYNDNYSSINDIILLQPYNYKISQQVKNTNRINRCVAFNPESQNIGWRTWLINDYYETPKNKGEIINIQGNDRDLFIQLEKATFTTVGNEQISIDGAVAFIGAGNIFERPAYELIPSNEGTLGTQHQFSCLLTQFGYVFIDTQTGLIGLLGKQNFEILSTKGIQRWLFTNLKFKSNIKDVLSNYVNKYFNVDNPYNAIGFTVGADYVYERLFITKKDYSLTTNAINLLASGDIVYINGKFFSKNTETGLKYIEIPYTNQNIFIDDSFTLSYNFKTKQWDYFHDFVADKYATGRAKTIVVGNKAFSDNSHVQSIPFLINEGKKGMYIKNTTVYNKDTDTETGIPYSFYISLVFNKGEFKKDFKNLTWITEVLNENKAILPNETINKILAFTSIGSTKEQTVQPFDFVNYFDEQKNVRLLKGEWNYNYVRNWLRNDIFSNPNYQPFIRNYLELNQSDIDANKSFETINRLIDYYLVVKYIYDNLDYNKEIRILQTNVNVLPVPR